MHIEINFACQIRFYSQDYTFFLYVFVIILMFFFSNASIIPLLSERSSITIDI